MNLCQYQFRPNSIQIHGVKYGNAAVIRIKTNKDGVFPFEYAMIKDIYVLEDEKVFNTNLLCVNHFTDHTKSLIVSPTGDEVVVTVQDIFCHGVLHIKQKANGFHLTENFYISES